VQPSLSQEAETVAAQKPISERALTSLASTAENMRAGSPLKARIEHLLSRVARKN